jgi:hypothetical protein
MRETDTAERAYRAVYSSFEYFIISELLRWVKTAEAMHARGILALGSMCARRRIDRRSMYAIVQRRRCFHARNPLSLAPGC